MQAEERAINRVGPIKAFVILLAVVGMVVAVAVLTRQREAPSAPATTSGAPDYSLTNAEALARFKELKQLRDKTYHQRDASLVTSLYSSDSPRRLDAIRELRQLRNDHVIDETRFVTLDVAVVSNSSKEIGLRQEVMVYPKVTSESGKDVTTGGHVEKRTVQWILRLEDGVWLVYDTVITAAEAAK
jgi:hypothetical protein